MTTRGHVLAKLKGIEMGPVASLIDEYQFILAAIEATLCGSRLVPDADVFEFVIDCGACREQFANMAPIHADVCDTAVNSVAGPFSQRGFQKSFEFFWGPLPRRLLQFSLLCFSPAPPPPLNFSLLCRLSTPPTSPFS